MYSRSVEPSKAWPASDHARTGAFADHIVVPSPDWDSPGDLSFVAFVASAASIAFASASSEPFAAILELGHSGASWGAFLAFP